MPEISRFFGIVITMYYRGHGPPHFHARYAGVKATVRIADGVIEGKLPKRAEAMVLEWWNIHTAMKSLPTGDVARTANL